MKQIVPFDATVIPGTAKCVFTGEIFDTYQWGQELFDGSQATFEMLRRPDTVEVACLVEDRIIVVNDEQPNRQARLSFPGGRVESGEAIEAAAKREIKEETGYEFKEWRLVKVRQPYAKIEWFIYLYIAWDGEKTSGSHLDAGERITVDLVTLGKLKKLIAERAGYLGEAQSVFDNVPDTQALYSMPEFVGKVVDLKAKQ